MTIWFATGNIHKKTELAAILNDALRSLPAVPPDSGVSVKIPADAGLSFDPDETGNSFAENALIKAEALYALLAKRGPPEPVIADDSGICVDALDGRPGIYSARYAGPPSANAANGTDGKKLSAAQRNSLLLAELGDTQQRSARFVCAMVLLFSPGRYCLVQETLEGEIIKAEQGQNGFGYDPIMFIPGLGRTVAQLSDEEKNQISHRGKAGKAIARILAMGTV